MTDIAIAGAGAAGLFAGIWAARSNKNAEVIALDGAQRIGAKILISGGGRCNITHCEVDEKAFAGSTPAAIRKILRRFDVSQTINFFESLGIRLKQESTGKLFPVSDRAQTVLDALLAAADEEDLKIRTAQRVSSVIRENEGFTLSGTWGNLRARKLILATGGMSVPKTGSDGFGYRLARSLGNSVTEKLFPALVPLTLPEHHFLTKLSGVSADVEIKVLSGTRKILQTFRNSLLCTHFGISGPAVLDISRHYINAKMDDPNAMLVVNWIPDRTSDGLDLELQRLNRGSIFSWLRKQIPDRLARSLCTLVEIDEETMGYRLTREKRKMFLQQITQTELPISGNRGFRYAEVTAGGVPLKELNLNTLESRICPGLFLCGEICDVDGRIGGFNFQWGWASGYVAGCSAASSIINRRNDATNNR